MNPIGCCTSRKKTISKFSELPFEVSPLYSKYTGLTLLEPKKVFFSNSRIIYFIRRFKNSTRGDKILSKLNYDRFLYCTYLCSRDLSKQGLIISTIEDAFNNHSELLKKYFEINASNYGEDRFLAFGLLLFNLDFFIYIPKNLIIKEPIRIVYSLKDDGYVFNL